MTEQQAIRNMLDESPEIAAGLQSAIADGTLQSAATLSSGEPVQIVGAHQHYNIDGSQRFTCACGKYYWLSPSTLKLLNEHTGPVQQMCVTCALALWQAR